LLTQPHNDENDNQARIYVSDKKIHEEKKSARAKEKAISGIRTTTSITTAGALFRINIFVTSSAASATIIPLLCFLLMLIRFSFYFLYCLYIDKEQVGYRSVMYNKGEKKIIVGFLAL
jgi:hypothetical protein